MSSFTTLSVTPGRIRPFASTARNNFSAFFCASRSSVTRRFSKLSISEPLLTMTSDHTPAPVERASELKSHCPVRGLSCGYRRVLRFKHRLRIVGRGASSPYPRVAATQSTDQEARRRGVAAVRRTLRQDPNQQRDRPFERAGNAHCPAGFSAMQRQIRPAVAPFEHHSDQSFNARRREPQDLGRGHQESEEFQNCRRTAKTGGEKVRRKQPPVLVPHRNGGRA